MSVGERLGRARRPIGLGLFCALLGGILYWGAARRAEWRGQLVEKATTGDGGQYYAIALHLEREHMISYDGRQPEWTRLPGYPVFLWMVASADDTQKNGVFDGPKTWAWLAKVARANQWLDLLTAVAALLLALALGARFAALGAALWWALQPGAAVVAAHPLSDVLATLVTTLCLAAAARASDEEVTGRARAAWFAAAGLLAAIALYLRQDSLLLAPTVAAAALLVRAPWRERLRLAAVAGGVFAAAFAPWPARNLARFGRPHALGGMGVDDAGREYDRSPLFAWMRSIPPSERASIEIGWKFPGRPVNIERLPTDAWDSPEERIALTRLFDDYKRKKYQLDGDLRARLTALAEARKRRHPFDWWIGWPARRALQMAAPRGGFGLGTLPTLREHADAWRRAGLAVAGAGLLGLAGLLARRRRRRAVAALAAWLALRTVIMAGWLPQGEPRYLLEELPLLAAAAATIPSTIIAAIRSRARRH